METQKETLTKVTLVLDDAEARWLKAAMQNPLYDVHPDFEDEQDKVMRKAFWEALSK